jgi:GT2 family glycosyltransferase
MKTAIAILTYNRRHAIQDLLCGLDHHCDQYPTAIFEDKGLEDDTAQFLTATCPRGKYDHAYLATRHVVSAGREIFLGTKNLGVAGQSNRAIHWWLTETDADHLCLMNDDLFVDGDFTKLYAEAHTDIGVELWCFCDFTSEIYRWTTIRVYGHSGKPWALKLMPRMTGIMMSMTRPLATKIGYFDAAFYFAQEHCEYTNRARLAGGILIENQVLHCLDIEQPNPPLLRHQDVASTMSSDATLEANIKSTAILEKISQAYPVSSWHRPYRLKSPALAGAYENVGIDTGLMPEHALVLDNQPDAD